MADGYIAVRGFQNDVREMEHSEVKDVKFDFDKVVTENISLQTTQYQPKSFVYHEQHGYLQVKKYEESR